jgi:hypothetical protein
MDARVVQELKSLIERHGSALGNDPRRLEAMLRDAFPGDRSEREIIALVFAARKRIPSDILLAPNAAAPGTYARRLRDMGLDAELCTWAVDAWHAVLKVGMGDAESPSTGSSSGAMDAASPKPPAPRGKGEQSVRCPQCGEDVPAGAKQCSHCGSRLRPPAGPPDRRRRAARPRTRAKILVATFLLVVLVGGASAAAYDAHVQRKIAQSEAELVRFAGYYVMTAATGYRGQWFTVKNVTMTPVAAGCVFWFNTTTYAEGHGEVWGQHEHAVRVRLSALERNVDVRPVRPQTFVARLGYDARQARDSSGIYEVVLVSARGGGISLDSPVNFRGSASIYVSDRENAERLAAAVLTPSESVRGTSRWIDPRCTGRALPRTCYERDAASG